MRSAFEKLCSLVLPPAQPRDASGDWNACEAELGLALPTDYKKYISTYGSGYYSAFDIPSPFTKVSPWKSGPMSPRQWWLDWAGIYEDWGKTPRKMPYPAYPSIPGLLPWGIYGDVDVLSWYTKGAPDQWQIVYLDREEGFLDIPDIGFAKFLVKALQGTAPLPESVLSRDPEVMRRVFTPY
jgi:hypothetical protein